MNLIKITEAEYNDFVEQLRSKLARAKTQLSDGRFFLLRAKTLSGEGRRIELLDFPRDAKYVKNSVQNFSTGFECKLQAFKAEGPFRVKIAARIRAESQEGGFFKFAPEPENVLHELGDDIDSTGLAARMDTFKISPANGAAGFVEVEFVASAILRNDERDLDVV